jgi:3-oxoacyl-[acyl-carrier protein] reductase
MTAVHLSGQVAVITGANSGIGRATARALSQAGAHVVLAARTRTTLEAVAQECSHNGAQALAIPTDVCNEPDIEALMTRTVERFGRLDILVTSAGGATFGPIMESRTEDWDLLMNVNLRGTYLCCRHALTHMLARKSGHILNVLSIASQMILPGSSAYTASKFGALGLTKVIAAEVRSQGVKVTAVIPGAVNTPLWDKSGGDLDRAKMLSADDVANAMLNVITQPASIHTDELVLMPPLGVL